MNNKKISNELISIIVPCFNNEKFVEKCLKSIDKQTYKNYEVIIINDGSKDNSKKVLEDYIGHRPNYRLINQDNQGVSSARNKGIEEAKGKCVCFVDADDYIEEDYLNLLYFSLIETDSDLCLCSVIHEDLKGKTLYIDRLETKTINNIDLANQRKLIWGYACNKLYKLDLIKKHNIRFEKDIKFAEDELFYLNYLFVSKNVRLIEKPLYHYVRQKESATKDTTNMSVQVNRFDSRRIIIDLLKSHNVNEYVINRHIVACIDTCLLVLAYKFKGEKLNKEQKQKYLKYIKNNKKVYLEDKTINWKAKFYLKLACFSLPLYVPLRRAQLRLTHRI